MMQLQSQPRDYSVIRFRDAEGRPLGESRLSTTLAEVPMRFGICRYPGSRFEHVRPMNLSALQQIQQHWPECRDLLAWVQRAARSETATARATLSDLWRTARLAQSLPGWLLLRQNAPMADGTLPAPVAATFKMVIGITYALQDLQFQAVLEDRALEHAPVEPDALMAQIEQRGLLIGPTQVCAGPQAMIRAVIALLLGGDSGAPLDPALGALIGDAARPARYAAQAMRFHAAGYMVELFVHALTRAVTGWAISRPGQPEPLREATDHLIAGLPDEPQVQTAIALAPDRLAVVADAIRRFMTGAAPDATPMGSALGRLTETYLRPRPRAEAMLADFIAAIPPAAPALPVAPLLPLFATHLALERVWLQLNRLGELGLEACLGRAAEARPVSELDRLLGRTALRCWFETAFGVTTIQTEDAVHLGCGGARLALSASLL